MKSKKLTIGLAGLFSAQAITFSALAADPVQFDRFRAYLIYEDTGKLSKNVARRTDQIVANDENGTSVQILIDIVATGGANQVYENNTLLLVWATDPFDEQGPAKLDKGWPITYVGIGGETIRSVIVDHDCGPFTLHARVDTGDAIGKEYVQEFNITCGD